MSSPLNAILTGSFVSEGAIFGLPLPAGYTEIDLINITSIGDAGATTQVMKAHGSSKMPAGAAYVSTKTTGAATIDLENTILANGFTFVPDSGASLLGPLVTNVTSITQATPAVVATGTPVPNGSVVRMTQTTGMLQIAGLDFTTSNYSAGVSFKLAYLPAAAFGAPATAGSFQLVKFDPRFYPSIRTITMITVANPAVITMSVTHGFTVGQKVRINVPAQFGMVQMNGLLATILAIDTINNTITTDIDSSAFTAFAYPTSAVAALGVSFPQVVPVGEAATVPYANALDDASLNISARGVLIGTAVQSAGYTYQWIAKTGLIQ